MYIQSNIDLSFTLHFGKYDVRNEVILHIYSHVNTQLNLGLALDAHVSQICRKIEITQLLCWVVFVPKFRFILILMRVKYVGGNDVVLTHLSRILM